MTRALGTGALVFLAAAAPAAACNAGARGRAVHTWRHHGAAPLVLGALHLMGTRQVREPSGPVLVRGCIEEGIGDELVGDGVSTAATALFTSDLPPVDLRDRVPKISGATLFVCGEHGQPAERPANRAFYRAARGPTELWEVPGSGHTGGLDARPHEYERRVAGFFDQYLRMSQVSQSARRDERRSRQPSGGSRRRVAPYAARRDRDLR